MDNGTITVTLLGFVLEALAADCTVRVIVLCHRGIIARVYARNARLPVKQILTCEDGTLCSCCAFDENDE